MMASHSSTVDHAHFMHLALAEARKSPPKPTNYCVGAVLVSSTHGDILATGYTLELPGNTHAEQCCLAKFAQAHGVPEERVGDVLPADAVIYTTMEPCSERLSGNLPCVDRIIRTAQASRGGARGIRIVYAGVTEPAKFVKENSGRAKLKNAGVEFVHVAGLEDEILRVATAGHVAAESES